MRMCVHEPQLDLMLWILNTGGPSVSLRTIRQQDGVWNSGHWLAAAANLPQGDAQEDPSEHFGRVLPQGVCRPSLRRPKGCSGSHPAHLSTHYHPLPLFLSFISSFSPALKGAERPLPILDLTFSFNSVMYCSVPVSRSVWKVSVVKMSNIWTYPWD